MIAGFYPDPTICQAGGSYYLANSTFEYSPGVPIWRSSNLTSWEQIGNILERSDQLHLDGARPSGGIYAPTLRYHAGQFWMATTNVSDPPGQLLVSSPNAEGPWSAPTRIRDAHGIDPDLAWDRDGRCWLSWSGEQPAGMQGILQAELDTSTGHLLSAPTVIWRGTGGQYPEGPHLYRRGDYWYLLIAEGGTERGHAATVARAQTPNGPFEPSPFNPLITARGTSLSTQNVGHADIVEREDGSWAMVCLGVRPLGSSPGWHILGRETFASELDWLDDWPVLGSPLEPEPVSRRLDVLGTALPLAWVVPSHDIASVMQQRDGTWHVCAAPGDEAFAGRRQQHFFTRIRAVIRSRARRAGLELRIDPYHRVGLYLHDGSVRATATVGGHQIHLGSAESTDLACLEIRTAPMTHLTGTPRHGPDLIDFGIWSAGDYQHLGQFDGRYLSTEVAGGFTGRMVGIVVDSGDAGVCSFEYAGSDQSADSP